MCYINKLALPCLGGGNGDGRVLVFFLCHRIQRHLPGFERFLPLGERARRSDCRPPRRAMARAPMNPPQSAQYEKLVEAITRTVAKLNLEWPTEKQAESTKRSSVNAFYGLSCSLPCRSCRFLCQDRGRNHTRPTSLLHR